MNTNIDKKEFFGETSDDNFADNFDRAFREDSEEDIEKIFMEEVSDIPDLPDEIGSDAFKDVLSSLSELDKTGDVDIDYLAANRTRTLRLGEEEKAAYAASKTDANDEKKGNSEKNKKSNFKIKVPNVLKPIVKALKASGKFTAKTINFLLRTATLLLIMVITCLLAFSFGENYNSYGNIATAIAEHNYTLAAYFCVALALLLFECLTFLIVLFGSKKKSGQKSDRCVDTGRGLFSFILIFVGSYLAKMCAGLIPASPAPLLCVQGALIVYGSLVTPLFFLCAAGVASCLIRRFILR